MLNVNSIFEQQIYAPAKEVAKLLLGYDRILLACHASPDADAIGSMYALAHGLKRLGKNIAMCNASDVPEYINWLAKPCIVHKTLTGIGFKPQVAVVLDCGDGHRLGALKDEVLAFPSICIDHHVDNPQFGSVYNWVDPRMAATGQMVAAILNELKITLNSDISESIYTAISSDTGNFRYDNTSEYVLTLAAHLVQQGLNIANIHSKMENTWTIERMHLWGELMGKVCLERNGSIALIAISSKQLSKHNSSAEDLDGFVEYLRRIKGVLAVALIREDHPKQCKASLRSSGDINVQAMLAPLGGGGHRNAAGATLKYSLSNGKKKILENMCEWLDAHNK